ncbi:hypothetical protein AB1L88_02800 [Tautonia sp. JC769]|uniref:hypothetical protein n=1 Tax=Tautonia sp. JC769 TaxID=3232135 RepID=UPI0034573BDA
MKSALRPIDDLLRGRPAAAARAWWLALLCGVFYGAVMGSFGGRPGQAVYSASKVPLLLATTTLLGLPSFFVLNTLLGVRSDFGKAMRAVVVSQAGLTIILASLAPVTAFWYASTTDYRTAILFNAAMFAVASVGAQWMLRRAYRPLIARNPVHRRLLGAWLLIYGFVGIQMGWLLRPFIGAPGEPVQFFRPGAWDNAYVFVARLIWEVLAGR